MYLMLSALALTSCASGGGLPPVPTAAEIPSLEAQVDADPSDADAGLRLASAYHEAGRIQDASSLISSQLAALPDHLGLNVMAGLLDEIALGAAGFLETATAARSGRILGSGHIVQGRYRIEDGSRIAVDAAIVEVGAAGLC